MVGCGPVKTNYDGSVKINTQNGTTTGIEIKFPGNASSQTINNPEDVDRMIAQTESMLITMKEARRQLGGTNPAPVPPKKD
jgi:hypothetical protein